MTRLLEPMDSSGSYSPSGKTNLPEEAQPTADDIKKRALHEIRKRRMLKRSRNALIVTMLLVFLEVGGALFFISPLGQPPQEIGNLESFFENVTVQNVHVGLLAEFSTSLTYFVPQSPIDEKLASVPWSPPPVDSTYTFFVNITGAHVANANGTYYAFRPESCAVTPNNYSQKKPEPWTYEPFYGECFLGFDYSGNFPLQVSVLVTTYNGTVSTSTWLGPAPTTGFIAVSPADTEVNYVAFLENQRVAQAAISIAVLSVVLQAIGIGFQLLEGPRRAEEQLIDERDREMIDETVDRLVQGRVIPPKEGDEDGSVPKN